MAPSRDSPKSLLDLELTALAAIDNIEGALAEEAGEEPGGEDATGDEEYGTWSAETGQVTAPGAAPAPPAGG
ncbi:MAG: hypothetical protein ACSLFO_07970 [Acidimicrobiales bacterium]